MNSFLEKNLQAIETVDAPLAQKISSTIPNEHFEVYSSDNDTANINIIDKRTHQALYTTQPIQETLDYIGKLSPYALYPYLYFYGIGNGIFYKLLLNNKALKQVIVIEPEPEILFIALHFVDLAEEITNKRLVLILSEDFHLPRGIDIFAQLNQRVYCKLYDLHLLSPYYNAHDDDYHRVNKILVHAIEHVIIATGNDSRDSIQGIDQHIRNFPDMVKSPTLYELLDKATNTDTAIIVSTGPSLHKQLPLLKEIAPYATLVCIDASFPILYANGIKPDIVVTLERVKESAKFYTQTPLEAQDGVIFALTSIVHEDLKKAIPRGIKQFSMRPFGYTRRFGLDYYGYVGIGMSAANMAFELVFHANFKRCVLIGQDLAFGEDGTSHAKGAVYGENEIKPVNSKDALAPAKLLVEKYGGGGEVETTTIWKMFLGFFEKDILGTQGEIEVINCTEGGARIHGAKEMPFRELATLLDKSKEKKPIVLEYPEERLTEVFLAIGKQKIIELFEFGYTHKKQVERTFLKVAGTLEEIEKLHAKNKLEEIDFKKVTQLIREIEKVKDLLKNPTFVQAFMETIQSYIIHQELEIAKIAVTVPKNRDERRAKQVEWLYAHKYWLFSLAGGMDVALDVVRSAAKTWMEIPKKYEERKKPKSRGKKTSKKKEAEAGEKARVAPAKKTKKSR